MSWPACPTCFVVPCICRQFQGAVTTTWQPLVPFRLSDDDVERIAKRVVELMTAQAELTGERDGKPCPPCRCGPARDEVVEHAGSLTFHTRTGCARCNTWDGPLRSR